jgi:hypothetical protein
MKLCAVFIPATSMLKPEELRYRLGRGGVWHVVTVCTQTDKFADNAHGFFLRQRGCASRRLTFVCQKVKQ